MDQELYHATLKAMHDAGVAPEYAHGWASGALGNPSLEEQRVTEAYEAGYQHGQDGNTDGYSEWLKPA